MLILLTIFGGLLPVFAALISYWKRSHVKVNCWFCGLNTRVLKQCRDGWICKHCEQYNGFKSDGDYNRDIPAQWDSSLNGHHSFCSRPLSLNKRSSNGLCDECNRNQEMKVAQLASFQPINPENFDREIENYSYHLERAYRLCPPCEAVLQETLSQKKTHVLDMNLLKTGKMAESGKYPRSKTRFRKSLCETIYSVTTIMTLSIVLSNFFLSPSDSIVKKFVGSLDNREVLPELSSYPATILSFFRPASAVCPQQETISSSSSEEPLSSLISDISSLIIDCVTIYSNVVQSHLLLLSLFCTVLEGIASCYAGFQATLFLWIAFLGAVLIEDLGTPEMKGFGVTTICEIVIPLLILFFSSQEIYKQKPNLSPVKRLKRANTTPIKRCLERTDQGLSFSNADKTQVASQNLIQSALLRSSSQGIFKHDSAPLDSSRCLSLPSRPSSALSHRTLTSASGLLDSSTILPSVDGLSNLSQEDRQSDASADSAFSNPDSITLDAADSLNNSYQLASRQKLDTQEGDVQSLIEGLSINPISRQSRRKSAELKKKTYAQERKRSSLLTPAKLTNIMNESASSGLWHSSHSSNQTTVTRDLRKDPSRRPGSPSDSVKSQATIPSQGSLKNGLPASSFRPVTPTWNSVASPAHLNVLSVAVPPSSLVSNSGFGSPVSPIPHSQVSHYAVPPHPPPSSPGFGATVSSLPFSGPGVMYTPYGLFHQITGPSGNPVFIMQPQSPTLSSQSPSSSIASNFSPQSFNTSSQNNSKSFYGSDDQSSPKTCRRGKRTKPSFSSSFMESVWQSRFAILYTTICYIVLGLIVYFVLYSSFATSVFTKMVNWKGKVLSFIRS